MQTFKSFLSSNTHHKNGIITSVPKENKPQEPLFYCLHFQGFNHSLVVGNLDGVNPSPLPFHCLFPFSLTPFFPLSFDVSVLHLPFTSRRPRPRPQSPEPADPSLDGPLRPTLPSRPDVWGGINAPPLLPTSVNGVTVSGRRIKILLGFVTKTKLSSVSKEY